MKKKYKGIILAGGTGSRLYPITQGTSKHLLSVYDKPMIYYPLSLLMLCGIRDILIISRPEYINQYERIFNDGSSLGITVDYKIQSNANGIPEAFKIGEEFIGDDNVMLILGDNLFYGNQLTKTVLSAMKKNQGATIFAQHVDDPSGFGVVNLDKNNKVISIEEKPESPKSSYAVTGLYLYESGVVKLSKKLIPSKRNETEISDLNNLYLKNKKLNCEFFGRGYTWLDTGSPDNLHEASRFVQSVQKRQGFIIACLEEIALNNGWIDKESIKKKFISNNYNAYTNYLLKIIE